MVARPHPWASPTATFATRACSTSLTPRFPTITSRFYRNDGDANFTDISYELHIAEGTFPFLGWGTAFFDYDNDGWKDLIFVNGHVYEKADTNPWGTSWQQRLLLFHNADGKRLDAGACRGRNAAGRGAQFARHGRG